MFVDYRIFLSVRFPWALLACLRWSLGTLGLPWVPLDGHWGSFCHLCRSIGVPLERHWAPFVAFRDPLGRLRASLGLNFGHSLEFSAPVLSVVVFEILFKEKNAQ